MDVNDFIIFIQQRRGLTSKTEELYSSSPVQQKKSDRQPTDLTFFQSRVTRNEKSIEEVLAKKQIKTRCLGEMTIFRNNIAKDVCHKIVYSHRPTF